MPSFLENLRPFYGTNEKNAAGESLEEFLEHYDPYKYRTPSCTTDAVIFLAPEHLTKELKGMRVLLVKRSNHPSIGFWALPGGFIEMRENLDDTARRELLEETSVDGLVMEQIGTYGDYDRDPRTRVITTAYMAVLQGEERQVRAGDDAADAVWCDLELEEISVQTGGGQTDGDANGTKRGEPGICYRVYPPCDEPGTGSGHERFGRIPAKRNAGARRIFFGKRSGGDRSGSCGDHRAGAFCFEIKIIKNPFRKPAERTCRFLKRDFYHVPESEIRFY